MQSNYYGKLVLSHKVFSDIFKVSYLISLRCRIPGGMRIISVIKIDSTNERPGINSLQEPKTEKDSAILNNIFFTRMLNDPLIP